MSFSSQQYAGITEHSYDSPTAEQIKGEPLVLEGVSYKILERMDRPSGYQGTIYQRVDTGEIVVAHRGTEFKEQPVQDVLLADGGMLLGKVNIQADDAIELARRALEYAELSAPDYGNHTPEVTVTGHSLGGALAQITAHHFDLRGETFNAYGAAGLGYRIPEGGDTVINHVMAGDAVSAASPHFGQVRIYALPEAIGTLTAFGGYDNNRSLFDDRNPMLAAGALLLPAHRMHNFLGVDGDGGPDRSVLSDPGARELAARFDPMIDKYRGDIRNMRAGFSLGAGGPSGVLQDVIDHVRGPLPPGEPARREQAAELDDARHAQSPPAAQWDTSDLYKRGGAMALPEYLQPARRQGPSFPYRPDIGQPLPDFLRRSDADNALQYDSCPRPLSLTDNTAAFIDRMLATAQSGDHDGFRQLTGIAADSDAARSMRSEAVATVDRQEQLAAEQLVARQQAQEQEQTRSHRGPRMR